jgi:HPt (histidine-containing phosphotransfer) domain-containing protein
VPALRHSLHQIKGSTAAFGFDHLSQLAAEAEEALAQRIRLDVQTIERVRRLLQAMRGLGPNP